jgi:hypothetical protein
VRPHVQVALEFGQRAAVDLALELDHGIERHPVLVPAPRVRLRALVRAKLTSVSRPTSLSRYQICFWPVASRHSRLIQCCGTP